MNGSKKNRFKDFESINCEACGHEYMRSELHKIKLSGFNSIVLSICDTCRLKNPQEQYKSAASLLKDITSIADCEHSPEERLAMIKDLLK